MPIVDNRISVQRFSKLLFSPKPPVVVDVRRAQIMQETERLMVNAVCLPHDQVDKWHHRLCRDETVVVYCAHGHQVSQIAVSALHDLGYDVRILTGGIEAYEKTGGATVSKTAITRSHQWVTGRHLNTDTLACYWLLTRFAGWNIEVLFVDDDQIDAVSQELGANVFGTGITHSAFATVLPSLTELVTRLAIRDEVLASLVETLRDEKSVYYAGVEAVLNGVMTDPDSSRVLRSTGMTLDSLYREFRRLRCAQ